MTSLNSAIRLKTHPLAGFKEYLAIMRLDRKRSAAALLIGA